MLELKLGNQRQRLSVGDLTNGGCKQLALMLDGPISIVYSDPPWNPGNETYWRTRAGAEPGNYSLFLEAWLDAVIMCRGLEHVFCEQSVNDQHRALFLDAVKRQRGFLPLIEEWEIVYSAQRRPNRLLHFGATPISTDPSGMHGDPMTKRVFEGLGQTQGMTVLDPCTGKGTTSRMAHWFGMNFVGLDLNAHRLDHTINWLRKQGYR